MPFAVSSPAFRDGATIPKQFTCDGSDTPPPIQLSDPPKGTKSFAVIVDDPDAPGGTFTHWLAYDIPAGRAELPANAERGCETASDARDTVGRVRRRATALIATSSPCTRSMCRRSRSQE
jgi:hypothetical protein